MKQQRHAVIQELLVKTAVTSQDELRRKLRMKIFKINGCPNRFLPRTAQECRHGSLQSRMTQQQTRQFAAGVAADPCYRGARRFCGGIAGPRIGAFDQIDWIDCRRVSQDILQFEFSTDLPVSHRGR